MARKRPSPPVKSGGSNTWRRWAACRGEDPVLFFGPDGEQTGEAEVRERRAVAFCKKYCHVQQACLSWALAAGEVGVWGGTTADERRTIKRRTQRVASRAALQTTP